MSDDTLFGYPVVITDWKIEFGRLGRIPIKVPLCPKCAKHPIAAKDVGLPDRLAAVCTGCNEFTLDCTCLRPAAAAENTKPTELLRSI